MKLTEAHRVLLKAIRKTRKRPSIHSDDWDRFVDLQDAGLVEDGGLGNARITQAGRAALKERTNG